MNDDQFNDGDLKRQVQQAFAGQQPIAPDFQQTIDEANTRFQKRENARSRRLYPSIAAAVIVGIAFTGLQFLPPNNPQLPQYVTVEDLSADIWVPPSNALLPPYPTSVYETVPTLIDAEPLAPGEFL